jgi:hypothetical protein
VVAVAGDRGHRDLGQLSQALNTELAPLVDELFAIGNAGLDRFLFRIGVIFLDVIPDAVTCLM